MKLPTVQTLRETVNRWLQPPPINFTQVIAAASVEEQKRQSEQEKMRGLLVKALDTIERLEYHAAESSARASNNTTGDLYLEIMSELQEAAALADGAPWQAGGKPTSHAGKELVGAYESIKTEALREAQRRQDNGAATFRETIYGMAELEIALEDRGWKRLIAQSQYEFSRFGIQSIILICRLYYIKNPLARRGVDCSAFYIFGRGFEITSTDEAAQETLQDFFTDPLNAAQFSHTAMVKKEKQTYTDGNVFWAFFSDPSTGKMQSRAIDSIEVSDIITDPEDADTPWFYRRDWTEQQLDLVTGRRDAVQRTLWYVALGYEDMPNFPSQLRKIETWEVATDDKGQPIPVLHLKDGELPGWHFGCPRMYPAVDWLRAYRHVLEDLCTTWRALARFAWNVETKGGAPAIAAFKQVLATTLMNDLSQIETNPPPATGAAFISGPNNKITPFQSGGSTTMNPDNARRVLLMVCSAFGLGEHMMGDACYSADTEVLTEDGFVLHQDWRPGTRVACYNPDTSRIEWREPFELHTYFRYEPLVHFENAQTDIAVTPNHRMWTAPVVGHRAVKPVVDRSWRIETAEFLEEQGKTHGWRFKARFDVEESHIDVPSFVPIKSEINWAAFLGYWISEGCSIEWTGASGKTLVDGTPGAQRTFRRVMLSQNEGSVLEDMKATLRELGLHFGEGTVQGKQKSLSIHNKALWDYLRECCGKGSHSKRIPREMFNAPEPVRRALYNALMAGDGGRSGSSWRYSTASKQLADDMQILATTLGFAASITVENREFNGKQCPINRVWIRTEWTEASIVQPKHISRQPYCGLVYCFNLPYGIYVTRRNGKIAVQGNTTGSLATAASLERPTELMFLERQEVWREVLQRIGRYVLTRSLRAPKGKLREAMAKRRGIDPSSLDPSTILIEATPRKFQGAISIKLAESFAARKEGAERSQSSNGSAGRAPAISAAGQPVLSSQADIAEASGATDVAQKITVDVKFPDILEGGIGERITAIVDSMTLKGLEPNGIDQKTGTALLLAELGVEDPTVVLEAMFPAKTYEPDRTLEPMPPTRVTATVASTDVPQPDAAGPPDPNAPKPAPPAAPPPTPAADDAPASKKGKKQKAKEALAAISDDPEVIEAAVKQLLAAARRNLNEVRRMSA